MGTEEELRSNAGTAQPDVRVYLAVIGASQPPHEITSLLGVEPDESREMGKLITPSRPGRIAKFHNWKVTSGLPRSAPVEKQVEAVRQRLAGREPKLKHVSTTNTVELAIVPECPDGTSRYGYTLDAPSISFLAEAGASVDADEYFPKEGRGEYLPDDLEDPRVEVSLVVGDATEAHGEPHVVLDSGLPPTAPVDDHLDALRRRADEVGALWEKLPEGADVVLSITVELPADNDTYGLHLDEDTVQFLAGLGAGVVVDHHLS